MTADTIDLDMVARRPLNSYGIVELTSHTWKRIQVELLAARKVVEAFPDVLNLASVSYDGDDWFAVEVGLDGDAILKRAESALAEYEEATK